MYYCTKTEKKLFVTSKTCQRHVILSTSHLQRGVNGITYFQHASPHHYIKFTLLQYISIYTTVRPSFDLSSSSFLLLKWENDGRTMGELRTKERRKCNRTYIGLRGGQQNKTVIISLSVSHVSALLLESLR